MRSHRSLRINLYFLSLWFRFCLRFSAVYRSASATRFCGSLPHSFEPTCSFSVPVYSPSAACTLYDCCHLVIAVFADLVSAFLPIPARYHPCHTVPHTFIKHFSALPQPLGSVPLTPPTNTALEHAFHFALAIFHCRCTCT